MQAVGLIGHRIVAATDDGSLHIWDVENVNECHELCVYRAHVDEVVGLGVFGRTLVSASFDGTICITRFGPEGTKFM